MKVGKPQSKRVSVRLRHKIQKSSANKQRKQRKDSKKNPQWRSRLKKDPGIPNLFPYKDKILAEIEESKQRQAQERERRKDVARSQREGRTVEGKGPAVAVEEDDEDEEFLASEDESIIEEDNDEMDTAESSNPMAALLASAQARANTFKPSNAEMEDEDEEDEEDNQIDMEVQNFRATKKVTFKGKPVVPTKKTLPKSALEDPIKPINRLLTQLQQTAEGMQQILDYYQLPPLVTAGSDVSTRFLVDVARKRGRLGRGGVPSLNGAALTVLGDLNEGRLKLPALQQTKSNAVAASGKAQVVSQLAEPFKIEGLWGDSVTAPAGDMEIES